MSKNFNEIPRGQLSAFILSTLVDGDKYGYEIIDSIEKKTNGAMTIKQPSLYSSLRRMEDQDLISSYWMDSDIGGRRHYYRLTDYGRKQMAGWQAELDKTIASLIAQENSQQPTSSTTNSPAPTFLQQESFLDIKVEEDPKKEVKPFEDDAVLLKNDAYIQFNLFDNSTRITQPDFSVNTNNNQSQTTKPVVSEKEDEKQIEPIVEEKVEEPKQGNYDIYAELDNMRRSSKSFVGASSNKTIKNDYHENTLESFMGDSFVLNKLDDISKISVEESIVEESKASDIVETQSQSSTEIFVDNTHNSFSSSNSNNMTDDSKFITERYIEEEMPKAKKITPASIDVFSTTKAQNSNKFERSYVHQSYDEKIVDLYSKVNQNEKAEEMTPLTISNYTNLRKYFNEQKISFKPYSKNETNTTQTSLVSDFKFSLIRYSITLFSLILSLFVCFLCIRKLSYIPDVALTYYILPPLLFILFAGFSLILKAKNKDRKILLMEKNKMQLVIKIAICIILAILIYVFNLVGGLNSLNFNDYTNSMIVPFIVVLHIPLTSLHSYITSKIKWIR